MTTVGDLAAYLESLAPTSLAADWDNVGLLLGDRSRSVAKALTCLTVSPAVVDEAIDKQVDLVVAHHPLPFRPLKTITADTHDGGLVWRLASAGISLYSPHTAFDSASDGINRKLAEGLGLVELSPLEPIDASTDPTIGVGRQGRLPKPLKLHEFADVVKKFLKITGVDVVGADDRPIERVGVACGSAGELLRAAIQTGCDCFVTGEARFHTAVEADAAGIAMILVGHYSAERYGIEHLAELIAAAFPNVMTWAAETESDPLRRL